MSKSCSLRPPIVNGAPSKLYIDLLKNKNLDRPLVNYIYARYVSQGISSIMSEQGYKKDAQGQHSAKDVLKFFDIDKLLIERGTGISRDAMELGVKTPSGELVDFNNWEDAFDKVNQYNNNHTGRFAYVVKNGDNFNVIIANKDSSTLTHYAELIRQQSSWEGLKYSLEEYGIDINTLSKYVNPINVRDFLNTLSILKHTENKSLTKDDITLLLLMNPNSQSSDILVRRFGGNIEDASEKIIQLLQDNSTASQTLSLINENLDKIKKIQGIDSGVLKANIEAVESFNLETDEDYDIKKTIDALNKKYHINTEITESKREKIKTITDALTTAIFNIERVKRNVETTSGDISTLESLQKTQDALSTEYDEKTHSLGLTAFLKQALDYAVSIDKRFEKLSQNGDRLKLIQERASLISRIHNYISCYKDIVTALSFMDMIALDGHQLSNEDIETIQSLAKQVKEFIDKTELKISDIEESAITDLCIEVFGDNPELAPVIASYVNMESTDATVLDYLYSVGRMSNPLLSVLGQVIRSAQDVRDEKMRKIQAEIRKITYELYHDKDNPSDTDFMYDEDGHIISDIDWIKYQKERGKQYHLLKTLGFKGLDLRDAMETWELENTEERIVDRETGRIERVPDSRYRDSSKLNSLTEAQKRYYDKMMDLYGRIGSLLPPKYQNVYRPPMIRKKWHQIAADAVSGKISLKKAIKQILNHIKFWQKQEDDLEYGIMSTGDVAIQMYSSFDDTMLKRVPIFYIGQLEDPEELMKNFSMGIQQFAQMAINYDAMNRIKDICEMISDYVSTNTPLQDNGKSIDSITTSYKNPLTIIKKLRKNSDNSTMSDICDGFIAAHLYGIKQKDSYANRIAGALTGLTSKLALTTNLVGGTANLLVGEYQMLIEAGAGEFYNLKEFLEGQALLFGLGAGERVGHFMDYLNGTVNSKAVLLAEMFDPENDGFSKTSECRYYRNKLRQLVGGFDSNIVYGEGEKMLHLTNMYAVLCHEKVVLENGETTSLFNVLQKKKDENGNSTLVVKEGARTLDGRKIDENYLMEIKRRIREVNQLCHGAMNSEDIGLFKRSAAGKLVLNFRQWMIEHVSRRYRGEHYEESDRDGSLVNFYFGQKVYLGRKKVFLYDACEKEYTQDGDFKLKLKDNVKSLDGKKLRDEDLEKLWSDYKKNQGKREGYVTTFGKFALSLFAECSDFAAETSVKWKDMTPAQKANIRRIATSAILFAALLCASFALGDEKDTDDAKKRFLILQMKRLLAEAAAFFPLIGYATPKKEGMYDNFTGILNSIIPASRTVDGLIYPIVGLMTDLGKEYERGPHEGKSVYWTKVKKKTFVPIWQIESLINIDDDDALFYPFRRR